MVAGVQGGLGLGLGVWSEERWLLLLAALAGVAAWLTGCLLLLRLVVLRVLIR